MMTNNLIHRYQGISLKRLFAPWCFIDSRKSKPTFM